MAGKYSIGVDLGGTKVLAAVVETKTGKLIATKKKRTKQANTQETLIQRISAAVDDAIELAGLETNKIDGIGVGAAGMVDRQRGILLAAANLGVSDISITRPLEQRYGVKAQLGNDVEVATYGERYFGAGQKSKHFVCVFVGTGIGSGIVVHDHYLKGQTGTAGEIGHTKISPDGRKCGCGGYGCLEAYASRLAIAKTIKSAVDHGQPTMVSGKIDMGKGILRSSTIAEAVEKGDPVVSDAVKAGARYLAWGLASVVNFFNPERIILGGGLVEAVDLYYDVCKQEITKIALPIPAKNLKLVRSQLGDNAGVVGAALMASSRNGKNR